MVDIDGQAASSSSLRPLVAVVTPVYNGGPLLARTLACVQSQTYPNIVHVVLDNASKDATPDLIAAAAGGSKRIITRRNAALLPQIENWNAAMAMAPPEARYIKLLTADDLMRKDCVEKMVAAAELDPEIDFVHAIDVFGGWTKPHGLDPAKTVYSGAEYGRRWMAGEITWLSGSHMFFRARPALLKETFSREIFPLMDMEFIFRELLNRKMAFVFEPLIFTRYTENAVTAKLGGLSSYIMPSYRLLLKHGRKFLDEQAFATARRRGHVKIARHLLAASVTGHPMAVQIRDGLDKEKLSVGPSDYISAVAGWPLHKLTSSMRNMRRNDSDPPVPIGEEYFAS